MGRAKAKAKGRAKSQPRKGNDDQEKANRLPCKLHQTGECPHSRKDCRYPHRYAKGDEIEKLKRINPRARSAPAETRKGGGGGGGKGGDSSGGGTPHKAPHSIDKPCHEWSKSGTCLYGDRCIFKHDEPSAPAAKKKGGKKKGGTEEAAATPKGKAKAKSKAARKRAARTAAAVEGAEAEAEEVDTEGE